MSTIANLQNSQIQQIQQPQKKTRNKGAIRGFMAGGFAVLPVTVLNTASFFGMRGVSKISKKDSIDLSIATQEALKQSGLAQKGVKVIKVKESNLVDEMVKTYKQFPKMIKGEDTNFDGFAKAASLFNTSKEDIKPLFALVDELKGNKLLTKIINTKQFRDEVGDPDKFLLDQAKKELKQFKMGLNACFLPNANKVLIPSKNLQTSVFHELGHALNANGNAILRGLQKCRPLAKIVPAAVLAISLLNKRPKDSEKLENTTTKNKIQNVADGIKNNAGLIAGLSMFPMLLEEGLATLRGENLAKNLIKDGILSKDIFKKVKLTNLCGFASYASAIAAVVIFCQVAIKIKDKIQIKHNEKRMAKMENASFRPLQAHQG